MGRKFVLDAERGSTSCCCGACYCSKKVKLFWYVFLGIPLLLLLCMLLGILINAAVFKDPYHRYVFSEDPPQMLEVDRLLRDTMAERLSEAISFPTISYSETEVELEEIANFNEFLSQTFPAVYNASFVEVREINTHSRLLRVQGVESTTNPYMLCAHLDVVPPGGESGDWTNDPFEAGIVLEQEGNEDVEFIFGRGAVDDKHSVMGILEALNARIEAGDRPKRTLYLAFGHDEEVSGHQGAANIAIKMEELLEENDEELAFILDEGMSVYQNVVPGVSDPVITIGVAEKGWAVFDLRAEGKQVHSSIPERESAIGVLAGAVNKLDTKRQPNKFGTGVEVDTIRYAAPHASYFYKLGMANLWILSDVVSAIMSADPATDATQRTTTAVTIFEAGIKENVIPGVAEAVVNHRIHTDDNVEAVRNYDIRTIDDDRVSVTIRDHFPPTKVSPYGNDDTSFQAIAVSALEVYPDAHPSPAMMVANTDTVHYANLTDSIYRFAPTLFRSSAEMDRFHGINEKISVDNYIQVVQFYHRLMINADYDIVSHPVEAKIELGEQPFREAEKSEEEKPERAENYPEKEDDGQEDVLEFALDVEKLSTTTEKSSDSESEEVIIMTEDEETEDEANAQEDSEDDQESYPLDWNESEQNSTEIDYE